MVFLVAKAPKPSLSVSVMGLCPSPVSTIKEEISCKGKMRAETGVYSGARRSPKQKFQATGGNISCDDFA
jgi:hypothetical protein